MKINNSKIGGKSINQFVLCLIKHENMNHLAPINLIHVSLYDF